MAAAFNLNIFDNKQRALAWTLLAIDQGDSTFFDVLFDEVDITNQLMTNAIQLKKTLIRYSEGEQISGTIPEYDHVLGTSKTNVFKINE